LAISIDVFSAVHTRLILELPSSRTPTAFLIAVECIDLLLREKAWTVIQHTLDTTVSSLTVTCSSLGPSLTPQDTDAFYTAIARVISSILAHHRHRIRSRHHLVVALLNQLLTCLFTPRLSRRKTEAALHPPWLQPPTNPPLSLRAARAFSRVLQAFCDPPVSTVRTYKSELTESERGKERKMVSATVGPVLECFVKRVLEERMDVEVRKEVGVGMDKVLEVLGREGMGRVTGRMTAEGRAVVRGLWD
jgi:nucleolar pre-ribosomal-associated protein 2